MSTTQSDAAVRSEFPATENPLSPVNASDLDDDESFVSSTGDESGEDVEFYEIEEIEESESFMETGDDDDDNDDDDDDDDDGTETEFHDAQDQDGQDSNTEASTNMETTASGNGGRRQVLVVESEGRARAVSVITRDQILQLLRQPGARHLLRQHGLQAMLSGLGEPENESEDEDDLMYSFGRRRRRRTRSARPDLPPIPSPAGQELMESGTFGAGRDWQDELRKRKKRTARILMNRELGISTEQVKRANQEITQSMIPPTQADTIVHYDARCYSGQFSDDGNFFFACAKDFMVRMYNTSNPYRWKYYKTVIYPYGQWTITDASLSPDNRYLAYSSIRSLVCLAVTDPNNHSSPLELDFSNMAGQSGRATRGFRGRQEFGIWSLRFSGDGREIVAGTSDDSVYVFDIEANCSILRIPGHSEDVNAVCYGDTSSPHILYSGSDDTLIKVWDRRSMSDSREAGVFMGHTEGVAYVDSKGDGRYVLSNGKDQSMKLWDLRKMMSTEDSSKVNHLSYMSQFDYRYMESSDDDYRKHDHDCSVVTFRGHKVLKTLIRCHFSPSNSTNSRYVYSGSADGNIHIYNMDATTAGIIDVGKATYETRPRGRYNDLASWDGDAGRNTWSTCVRDVSWHPNAPVIAATAWNGWGMSMGTCSIHSWNEGVEDDESGEVRAQSVNDKLVPDSTRPPQSAAEYRRGYRSRAVERQDDGDDDNVW